MKKTLEHIINGYSTFRKKYNQDDLNFMKNLSIHGQAPQVMVVACSDSRVDPALILQTNPGDLFVVRNVANIVPPYEKDESHHGVSAALEFGVCFLNVKHLILLGHSQCGGIKALVEEETMPANDFISKWVSIIHLERKKNMDYDDYAQKALHYSYENCLTFPWIKQRVTSQKLQIHQWFFDISKAKIFCFDSEKKQYLPLEEYA
jgi:carbonic anhydrase